MSPTSWQHGAHRPDPEVSDAGIGHRPAVQGPTTEKIAVVPEGSARRPRFRPGLPRVAGSSVRRAAISALSGLLMLSGLFVVDPDGTPGFARAIVWDDVGPASSLAQLPTATSHEAARLVAAPREPAPSRPPTSPTPSPKLEPLHQWVLSARAASLWSRPDGSAVKLVGVPEKFYLRVLGQAENGRLPVYYEEGKQGGKKLGAWIDLADVWSPADQSRVVASSRGGARPAPDISSPERFIAAVAEAARESQRDSMVPASVTIAQAILESDWGKSLLSKKGNNYFGIKATAKPGPAGVISMSTWEVLSGKNVTVKDAFRAYNSLWESVMDHGRFLADNPRYSSAFKALNDAREFAMRIHAAGYATDPAYSSKLINLMEKFNLYKYDLP